MLFFSREAETERKSILGQIRNYERSTEEEMVKGEHLLALKNKREEELRAAERTFHDLTQEKKELQDELAKLNDMVECTEVNFKHATEVRNYPSYKKNIIVNLFS